MKRRRTQSSWGGVREGAGRPRDVEEPIRLAVDVERPDVEALRAIGEKRGVSVSSLVREAIRRFVRRAKG